MRILVVVDSINTEAGSGPKANVALINNLVAAGFQVLVYHYTKKNIQLSGVSCCAIPEIKYSPLYFLSRLQRLVSRNFKVNLAPFLERQFGFSFTFFNDTRSIFKALKKQTFEPNLVLTLSKGGSFRPHYALLQLPEWHSIWMAYVHDPYPFHFYPSPYNWVEPSYKFKEKFFLQVADKARYSAFPSQLLLEWMGSYYAKFLESGVVIPHQNSKIEVPNNVFPSYFDPSKFNILHAGALLEARSPEGLIEGFKIFLDRNESAKNESRLLLIGSAVGFSEMLVSYQKLLPELFVYDGVLPFNEVYQLQQKASVNVILEAQSEISPFLPAKFPHCVAANKMILSIAPFYSEIKRLLGEDYVYCAGVEDALHIANLMEKLYYLWKEDPKNILLNRPDLEYYLSFEYLKQTLNNLQTN